MFTGLGFVPRPVIFGSFWKNSADPACEHP
jgi:hypothetical protein